MTSDTIALEDFHKAYLNIITEYVNNRPRHCDNYRQSYLNKIDDIEKLMSSKIIIDGSTKESTDFYKRDFPKLAKRLINNVFTKYKYIDFVDVDWRSAFIFMEWDNNGYVRVHDEECYNRYINVTNKPVRGKIMVN